jgi:hypothetical protein
MDRSLFIKRLATVAGISTLPIGWVKVYDKFYLLQSFIAGFKYYKGTQFLDSLKEGDALELVREPENEYDTEAIAVYWNENKVGFIPSALNSVFAKLIDIQVLELYAQITHLKPEAKSWENVAMAIYCLKERGMNKELPAKAQRLMVYERPKYFSVRRQEVISRIKEGTEEENIVVNINTIPNGFERLRKKYGAGEYRQEDMWFSTEGYRILDEADVEELLPAVKEITEIADTLNQHFTEIKFDLGNCIAL